MAAAQSNSFLSSFMVYPEMTPLKDMPTCESI